jgi:glycosyltransferase involved in cell wall biosynthesis
MNVGIVFPTVPPIIDGGGDYVANLATALVGEGLSVHVFAYAAEATAAKSMSFPFRTHPLPTPDETCEPKIVESERHRVQSLGLDLLHVVYPSSRHFDSYVYPRIVGRLGVPVVATVWGFNLRSRQVPLAAKMAGMTLIRTAAAVMTHDPTYAAVLRIMRIGRRGAPELVPVGYNLADPTQGYAPGEKRPSTPRAPPRIAYFGGIDPSRGIEDLFEAFRRVLRSSPTTRLVMIGASPEVYASGPCDYYSGIRRRAEVLGIAPSVDWTPRLDRAELESTLTTVACVVLPFRSNSFGRSSLAAALTLGCPTVVATPRGFMGYLRHLENCWIVPRHSPRAIAEAIHTIIESPGLAARIGRGAQHCASQFSWPSIARQTAEIYSRTLSAVQGG